MFNNRYREYCNDHVLGLPISTYSTSYGISRMRIDHLVQDFVSFYGQFLAHVFSRTYNDNYLNDFN